MVLDFRRTFLEALSAIKFKKHEEFLVHGEEREVLDHS
jgi:hypothetical protein